MDASRNPVEDPARADDQFFHRVVRAVEICLPADLHHAAKRAAKKSPKASPTRRKSRRELAKTEAERQKILAQAGDLANKLIEEARAAAARVREVETQKAIAAAEQIITKAREAAAQDHARMLAELKREVGRLVVQTTTTVTGKILTPEDQRRLAEETEKQLTA